ncbi:MAG: nucleotidyltransferase family protein [Anaerolineae bacterium]|nr:nucleotidyltransferase family protein [Anaerolineae bacterium]
MSKQGQPNHDHRRSQPELDLLFDCARTELDAAHIDRLRQRLAGAIDWAWLLAAAEGHGVLPLLYQHLNCHNPEAVPAPVLAELRRRFQANAMRNLAMTRELLSLLDRFEPAGIMAIPYKGPALAASAYGNLALRQFVDLDILVRPRDVLRAKRLIMAQGYRPRLELNDTQEAMLLQANHQYSFWHPERQVYLELQWGFTRKYLSFDFDLAALWQRRTTISLGGRTVAALSPEDRLLILCVHGAKHFWARLGWISDIAAQLRTEPNLAWDAIIAQARQLGSERILYLGLGLAGHYLDAPLPPALARTVTASPDVQALIRQVHRHYLTGSDPAAAEWPEPAYRHRLQLQMRERLRDKVSYCVRLALAPTEAEQMTWPLPPGLSFVHNLFRPLRLVRKYGFPPNGVSNGVGSKE